MIDGIEVDKKFNEKLIDLMMDVKGESFTLGYLRGMFVVRVDQSIRDRISVNMYRELIAEKMTKGN